MPWPVGSPSPPLLIALCLASIHSLPAQSEFPPLIAAGDALRPFELTIREGTTERTSGRRPSWIEPATGDPRISARFFVEDLPGDGRALAAYTLDAETQPAWVIRSLSDASPLLFYPNERYQLTFEYRLVGNPTVRLSFRKRNPANDWRFVQLSSTLSSIPVAAASQCPTHAEACLDAELSAAPDWCLAQAEVAGPQTEAEGFILFLSLKSSPSNYYLIRNIRLTHRSE